MQQGKIIYVVKMQAKLQNYSKTSKRSSDPSIIRFRGFKNDQTKSACLHLIPHLMQLSECFFHNKGETKTEN